MEEKENHSMSLLNRESLILTGINDVDSFNEAEITAFTSYGDLTVRGDMLHVEELNLETGEMKITGKITVLLYADKTSGTSVFKRLFGG